MATIIKIKNSGIGGKPSVLATGELAYSYKIQPSMEGGVLSNGGDRLYVGIGDEINGESADISCIGGKYFTDMMEHQKGILSPSSAVITDQNNKVNEFFVDNLKLDGNTLSITELNADLHIAANGTGHVYIDSEVDYAAPINVETLVGSADNIFLQPRNSGYVQISSQNSIRIPVGSDATRDPSPLTGMIRYNTTAKAFEGYDGIDWVQLDRLSDSFSSGNDTRITMENTTGANNDQIRMYTDGVERQRVEATGETKFSDDLEAVAPVGTQIKNNRISTFGTDILYLDPSFSSSDNTGSVVIEGNLTIKGVTTTVDAASTKSNDPTMILGYQSDANGDETLLTAPDGLDKGVEFRWFDTAAHSGFFGYDSSAKRFTFIEDASNVNDTFSGTPSDVRFGNALLTSLSFTVYDTNNNQGNETSVPWVNSAGDVKFAAYNASSDYYLGAPEGQVLQLTAAGIPKFGHISGGKYDASGTVIPDSANL